MTDADAQEYCCAYYDSTEIHSYEDTDSLAILQIILHCVLQIFAIHEQNIYLYKERYLCRTDLQYGLHSNERRRFRKSYSVSFIIRIRYHILKQTFSVRGTFRRVPFSRRGRGRRRVCLDWNESAQELYRSIGASPLSDWTVHRLDERSLKRFVESV